MINAEVTRGANENSLAVLRRFTKRVQAAGILPRVRSLRYKARELSHYKVKTRTLKVIKRREEVQNLIKLGKLPDKTNRY